jgi:NADPH:quinone reductase-like Zn-dependent oxidoreductase
MLYKRVRVFRHGGPEVLQVVEEELRPPRAGEARIRVLAAAVTRPDVSVRRGTALYTGTPLEQKLPFTPGYAVIGDIDALGAEVSGVTVGQRVGALTVINGYSEFLYWRADRLIPVPAQVDPAQAVPLILNYVVAYQTLHRVAKARAGETALIIGASGGIGTALLQLGRLTGLSMVGLASASKHAILRAYGAIPIDYRSEDFVAVLSRAEPGGLDVVLDGVMDPTQMRRALGLLRRGGRMVSFGEPASRRALLDILGLTARHRLGSKTLSLYGTSSYFLFDRQLYLEDWATLFRFLEAGKIQPVIAARFPLDQAAAANALLESGQVVGNIVLLAPPLLGDASQTQSAIA